MKKLLLLSILIIFSSRAFCQTTSSENDLIKVTIGKLFDSMREDDTIGFRDLFAGDIIIQHINSKDDTASNVVTENAADYIKQLGAYKKDPWDEQIIRYDDMNVGNGMAVVWASYKFFRGKRFDHCGITVFQLVKRQLHWKIVSVLYSIRTTNCPE